MSRRTLGAQVRVPLTLKFTLLILTMMLLAAGTQYLIIRMFSYRNLTKRLEQEVSLLLSSADWAISLLLDKGDTGSIQRLLENTGANPRLRNIRLYNPDGIIIAASDPTDVGKKIPEKIVDDVFSFQTLRAVSKIVYGLTISEYSVAIPIRGGKYNQERLSDITAVLVVRSNLENETREILAFTNTLGYQILVATVLIILTIGFFVYYWVLRPLRTFTAATGRIIEGDYEHTVLITQRDEFGSFAKAFNIMLREIENKTAALTEYSGRLEVKVMETNEKFLLAQKMEAVGRLAGGIAHDFNNILTAILGYCNLLLKRNPPGQPNHEFAYEIRKAATRAAALTKQLLAFSRKQILQPQVLCINSLIRNLEKMLGRLLEENIELETVLEEGLWSVRVDPSQIDQVLMNLVVNSRDAMPSGGKLLIETRNVKLDEEYTKRHPGIRIPGEFVMVEVSDTGIGMDKETMSHLFEPFFTTKEIGKGTGLGLSTVYGIVKQSGGYVWVYSEPEKGTSFKIYLPRVDEEQVPRGKPQAQPSLGHESHKETILMVEDDEAMQSLVPMVLREKGYTVLVASDGEEALRMFQNYEGKIDLVITDVIMPKMNGRELADKLKQIRSGLKVIFTSGYTSNIIVHHGVLDPGVVLLEKPIAMETLLNRVREVLDDQP